MEFFYFILYLHFAKSKLQNFIFLSFSIYYLKFVYIVIFVLSFSFYL